MEVIKPPGNSTHYISQKDGTLHLANPVVTDSDTLQCGTKTIWELDGAKQTKQSLPIKLTVDTAGKCNTFYMILYFVFFHKSAFPKTASDSVVYCNICSVQMVYINKALYLNCYIRKNFNQFIPLPKFSFLFMKGFTF